MAGRRPEPTFAALRVRGKGERGRGRETRWFCERISGGEGREEEGAEVLAGPLCRVCILRDVGGRVL